MQRFTIKMQFEDGVADVNSLAEMILAQPLGKLAKEVVTMEKKDKYALSKVHRKNHQQLLKDRAATGAFK